MCPPAPPWSNHSHREPPPVPPPVQVGPDLTTAAGFSVTWVRFHDLETIHVSSVFNLYLVWTKT